MIYQFSFECCTLDLSFFSIESENSFEKLLSFNSSKEIATETNDIIEKTMDYYNSYCFPCKINNSCISEIILNDSNQIKNLLATKYYNFWTDFEYDEINETEYDPKRIKSIKVENIEREIYNRMNLDYIRNKKVLVQYNHEITPHLILFESEKMINEIKIKKIYSDLNNLILEKEKLIVAFKIDKDIYYFNNIKSSGWFEPYVNYKIISYGENPYEDNELIKSFDDRYLI